MLKKCHLSFECPLGEKKLRNFSFFFRHRDRSIDQRRRKHFDTNRLNACHLRHNNNNIATTKSTTTYTIIVKYVKRPIRSFNSVTFFVSNILFKVFLLWHNNNNSSLLLLQLTIRVLGYYVIISIVWTDIKACNFRIINT